MEERQHTRCVIQLGPVRQTSGPSKDAGNRIGAGHLALLVFPVVSGDGTVGSFGLHGLAVRAHKNRGHHTQGTIT